MALIATRTGDLTSAWPDYARDGVTEAIALITAQKAFGRDGRLGTIVQTTDWRIDRQKSIAGLAGRPGSSNLQVQRNGAAPPSTVACLLVWDQYFFDLSGPESDNRIAELTRAIRHGLNLSVASYAGRTEAGPRQNRDAVIEVFEMTGTFSSPKPDFVSPQKPVR